MGCGVFSAARRRGALEQNCDVESLSGAQFFAMVAQQAPWVDALVEQQKDETEHPGRLLKCNLSFTNLQNLRHFSVGQKKFVVSCFKADEIFAEFDHINLGARAQIPLEDALGVIRMKYSHVPKNLTLQISDFLVREAQTGQERRPNAAFQLGSIGRLQYVQLCYCLHHFEIIQGLEGGLLVCLYLKADRCFQYSAGIQALLLELQNTLGINSSEGLHFLGLDAFQQQKELGLQSFLNKLERLNRLLSTTKQYSQLTGFFSPSGSSFHLEDAPQARFGLRKGKASKSHPLLLGLSLDFDGSFSSIQSESGSPLKMELARPGAVSSKLSLGLIEYSESPESPEVLSESPASPKASLNAE